MNLNRGPALPKGVGFLGLRTLNIDQAWFMLICHDPDRFPELQPLINSRVHLLDRLFKTDLEYIINHAEDQFILLDPAFVDLMVQLQSQLSTVRGFIILTDTQHMPQHNTLKNMHCYEELIKASESKMQLSAHAACPRMHVCVMGLWRSLYSMLLGR